MPAKSRAQRRFLNRKFGHAWVKRHHFDNKGKPKPKPAAKKVAKKPAKKKPAAKR
jgi:hypothetical protein